MAGTVKLTLLLILGVAIVVALALVLRRLDSYLCPAAIALFFVWLVWQISGRGGPPLRPA